VVAGLSRIVVVVVVVDGSRSPEKEKALLGRRRSSDGET